MPTRTPLEVAALRAAAEEVLAGPEASGYLGTKSRAVLQTTDWLAGTRSTSPASGDDALIADDAGIARERLRALDLETARRRAHEDGTHPGVVAQTLSWYLGRQFAEAPL